MLVDEKTVGPSVISAKNIGPAITVKIRAYQSECRAGRAEDAAGFRAILEERCRAGLRPFVPPEARARLGKGFRCAKILLPLYVMANMRRIVIDVIAHHDIQPAVPVVINKACGRSPTRIVEARLARHLAKLSVAEILKQPHRAVLRHEHVGPAIVVHIAGKCAHAAPAHVEAGTFADVLESPVCLLMKQLIARGGIGPAVLDEINVEPPVVVEVEQRHA